MKNLTWLADSRSIVKSFPAGIQDDIGFGLYVAQLGEVSVEIAVDDASGAYRAVYTNRFM